MENRHLRDHFYFSEDELGGIDLILLVVYAIPPFSSIWVSFRCVEQDYLSKKEVGVVQPLESFRPLLSNEVRFNFVYTYSRNL